MKLGLRAVPLLLALFPIPAFGDTIFDLIDPGPGHTDSGWTVTLRGNTGLVVDRVVGNTVFIEIGKSFEALSPNVITFHARPNAVKYVAIYNESVDNYTGQAWPNYQWVITPVPGATAPLGAAFNIGVSDFYSIDPFTVLDVSAPPSGWVVPAGWTPPVGVTPPPGWHPTLADYAAALRASGGSVGPDETFTPVGAPAVYVETVNDTSHPSRSFNLVQFPLPEPGTMILLGLGGLGLFVKRRRAPRA